MWRHDGSWLVGFHAQPSLASWTKRQTEQSTIMVDFVCQAISLQYMRQRWPNIIHIPGCRVRMSNNFIIQHYGIFESGLPYSLSREPGNHSLSCEPDKYCDLQPGFNLSTTDWCFILWDVYNMLLKFLLAASWNLQIAERVQDMRSASHIALTSSEMRELDLMRPSRKKWALLQQFEWQLIECKYLEEIRQHCLPGSMIYHLIM